MEDQLPAFRREWQKFYFSTLFAFGYEVLPTMNVNQIESY